MTKQQKNREAPSRLATAGAVVLTVLLGTGFALAGTVAPEPDAKTIAVLFPGGTTYPAAAARLARIDARITHIGRLQNIYVAHFEKGWSLIGLWRAGALLPLDTRAGGDCASGKTRIAALSPTPQ